MADMDEAFLNCGLEESISYVMYDKISPTTKTINAQVFRGQENRINLNIKNSGSDSARKFDIEIYVSRTDIAQVKINADTVSLKKYPGDTSTTIMRVAGIIKMDDGAFRLGLA